MVATQSQSSHFLSRPLTGVGVHQKVQHFKLLDPHSEEYTVWYSGTYKTKT